MLPAPRPSATCTAPTGRELLFPYASREASEFQQRAFERHMLECDLCYEDFLAVWRVSEIVEGWSESTEVEEETGSGEVLPGSRAATPTGSDPQRSFSAAMWVAVGMALGLAVATLV